MTDIVALLYPLYQFHLFRANNHYLAIIHRVLLGFRPDFCYNKAMFEKIFRDPVHNDILVNDPLIYELINTREFQRLRRIKQLGTTGYTFHGGEHSRFSHCLGVYDIARRMVERFSERYADLWNTDDNQLTMVAALLHDIGHGAYSHTFEGLFDTNHEAFTQEIILSEDTEINRILSLVSPDFPNKVASVINHTYTNKQVEQLISSQIDCDRMDYLLRDSFFTGVSYGAFDLTRILAIIQPTAEGISFKASGMHAVEDYILRRYQMYMQVYFHPASRAIEVLLQNLLKRAKKLYQLDKTFFETYSPCLIPFFKHDFTLNDYLALDDGVLNTYFQAWINHPDTILSDLSRRFINRQVFTSITFDEENREQIETLRHLVSQVGFDPDFYTAIHSNFDLPYDIYRPQAKHPRTQIDILQQDGSVTELSSLSSLVDALAGTVPGDRRFYFPKEMLVTDDLFSESKLTFNQYIKNGHFAPDFTAKD